jgi:TolB-like protein
VASLKVISRTSVMGYQATTKALTRVADELGVGSELGDVGVRRFS